MTAKMTGHWCLHHEDTVVDDPTPQDVVDALAQDLYQMEGPDQPFTRAVGGRRLVLLPQSSGGTPRSAYDRSSEDEEAAGPQRGGSPAVLYNRFSTLDEGQEAVNAGESGQSQWFSGSRVGGSCRGGG